MAVNGYLGHWGLDGRKPDQRYAEVGGRDADGENVIGDDEGPKWLLSSSQVFSKTRMEEDEGALFGEKPPDDGHRVNIIDPLHTSVGIGLSRAEGEYPRVSCSQEFIDHYGEYSDIPHALRRNGKFTLTGKLIKGAHIQCVDLRWEDFPKSMTADEINKTSAYGIPDTPTFAYFPEDDQHPVAVSTVGDHQEFSLDVATDKSWKPGLYYVVVWAYLTAVKEPQNISTRTFLLEPAK
jgi:hypothetical protein